MNVISGSSENPLGITLVNVRYILAGSVFLKERDCTQECVQFIRDNLTLANCISFFTFGVSSCQDLYQELLPFMWKNIEELGTRREFHTLSVHEIKCLLPSSAKGQIMGADAEEAKLLSELFMGIYKWSSVDPQCRMPYFAEISSKYPLSVVDANVLRQVFMEDCCKLFPLRGEAEGSVLEPLATSSIHQLSITDGASSSSGGKRSRKDSSVQKETVVIRRSNRKIKRLNYSEACVDDEIEEPTRTDERSKGKICSKAKVGPRLRRSQETSSTPLNHSDESSYCGSSSQSGSAESKRNNWELQEIDGYFSQSLNSVGKSLQTLGKLSVKSSKAEVFEIVSPKKDIIPVIDLTVSEVGGTQTRPVPQMMYFVSKPAEGNHNELMVMDLKVFKIRKVHDFPDGMDCIYLLHHHMYIFAMCTKISTTKEEQGQVVCCIDLTGKIRQFQIPIRHPRFNCDWILANHGIYVLGGFNKELNLSARVQRVQTIRPDLQMDLDREKLRKPRADHAVVLLRGDIYIASDVGGLVVGKNGPKLTASMEVFGCDKVMCMKKSRMPTKRRGLCVVVVNSFLYAIGGGLEDPGTELNTCEVYNPDTDKWTVAAPLIQARQNSSAFVMDGNIVIVGGNLGPPTMEKYDIRSNKWTLIENCSLPPGGYYKSVAFANY